MPDNKITKTKSIEEIRKSLGESCTGFDSKYILRLADEEIKDLKEQKEFSLDSNYYKAMTLFEFDKGILLLNAIPELHRVFAIEFSKNLQREYNCKTPSEKSLAEIVALNFVRVLGAQSKINSYLSKDSVTDMGIGYLNVMSKELDRAERHYLASLQALKTIKSHSFEVNIKTNTAVVGQNQIVQANNRQNKSNNS